MKRNRQLARSECEVCILAGGLSTRMGRDKARLRIGQRTMLGHVRAAAAELGVGVRVIRKDVVPRCGPLGGVLTGLVSARTRTEWVIFLSCDMPFVSAGLLRELMAVIGRNRTLRGVFTRTGRTAGFPFVVRREARAVVEGLIEAGEFSLQGLARRLKAKSVRVPRSRSGELVNINTPEELAGVMSAKRRDLNTEGAVKA